MDSKQLERKFYKEIVHLGVHRFGDEAWALKMAKYKKRPAEFAKHVLGSRWWSGQEAVGKALVKYRRVSVRSGNGVGKTYLAADIALWFLYTHMPAVVLTSAPTTRQVRHVLWHEIRSRFHSARKRLPGRLYHTRLDLGAGSFALGLATDSADGGVRFQGFHAENLL